MVHVCAVRIYYALIWWFPKNRGPPKSSILVGFSLTKTIHWGYPHDYGTPLFCSTLMSRQIATFSASRGKKGRPDILGSLPRIAGIGQSLPLLRVESRDVQLHIPIGSMYGIYANIWGILIVNVTIYGIHGSYGNGKK